VISPPPPAIAIVAPPIPVAGLSSPAFAGVLSVKRPIFNTVAGGLPAANGPRFRSEAHLEGFAPGGTTIGYASRTTGSNARDRVVSRCGTRRIRWVFPLVSIAGGGPIEKPDATSSAANTSHGCEGSLRSCCLLIRWPGGAPVTEGVLTLLVTPPPSPPSPFTPGGAVRPLVPIGPPEAEDGGPRATSSSDGRRTRPVSDEVGQKAGAR
jgi:hypothetical protein